MQIAAFANRVFGFANPGRLPAPTLTATQGGDHVDLGIVGRLAPPEPPPSAWASLAIRRPGWWPAWMPNLGMQKASAPVSRLTVRQVGSGFHVIGSLPLNRRPDTGPQPQAKAAWETMRAAAATAGITIKVNSNYRSISHQRRLFEKSDGSGKWVAAPGHSEHQTGLAFDIGTPRYSGGKKGNFEKSPAYRWLSENGARFGFAQSMSWEPWHWRYDPQGVNAAIAAKVRA